MEYLITLALYCFILNIVQISEQFNENLEFKSSLVEEDAIGGFVTVLDNILNNLARNTSKPDSNYCLPFVLNIDGIHEFTINVRPFGYCSYCCPIGNPSNHVNLYFTNKEKGGTFTNLKTIKKSGLYKSAGFRKDLLTIIYIHGFTEAGKNFGGRRILEAYLSRAEDYNIILVDWKNLSAFPWYNHAARNTKIVGNTVANILEFYNKTGEIDLSKVHLIGFSLGAQVTGFIGKRFKGKHKIPRITALDPAFPLFPLEDLSQRLSKFDANFVDVIHTNGGMFGFPISVGHADFYPNGGGILQPGCRLSNLIETRLAQTTVVCSHYLAYEFYAESVRNPKAFPAVKCGSISKGHFKNCRFVVGGYMGFPANKSSLGNFYLTTNDRAPFSRSMKEQRFKANIID
ncbi:hypothetical protein ILUMI_24970 [Ignelater luminosus]|uniref:Lipase domain-containing protein n=1 Tax=Ignelater luminosus TaxID=2038154 RepID=A0A8K0FWE2_IGNLU|nr:hypothetical protein ILUMI_24970 [Ignelater luminosus]